MGQGVSTKKHQGLTFGYLKQHTDSNNSSTPNTITTTTDLLLDRPEYYGLSTNSNNNKCHSNSNELLPTLLLQQRRPDSGYVEDNRLVKELAYIDTTYYLDTMLLSSSGTGSSRSPSKEPTRLKSEIDDNNNEDDDDMSQQKKLTFGDIMTKEGGGSDGSMQELHLSCRHLTSLSCTNLYYLTMVQKLDLSRNHLTHLPDAIGSLINLTTLQLAHNQLVEIPDTICGLINLTDLDLSHNRLACVSPYIGHLKKLAHLNLSHNHSLSELPIEVGGLESLTSLSVLHCPQTTMLPAELLQLPNLRRLKIASVLKKDTINNNNNEEDDLDIMDDLKHDPPSLFEICARRNVKEAAHYMPHVRLKPCSACGKPYFQSYVSRRRLVERPDSTLVMFEYRLCSAHWTDDNDRMRYIFSQSPSLASKDSHSSVLKYLPPIVDLHPNHQHQKQQQQHLKHLYHQHSERSGNNNNSSNNNNSTSSMRSAYNNLTTTIEEEKIATTSRWRPQRFFRTMKH